MIKISNATIKNLHNLSLTINESSILISGVSGAGKSALLKDIIYAECIRRNTVITTLKSGLPIFSKALADIAGLPKVELLTLRQRFEEEHKLNLLELIGLSDIQTKFRNSSYCPICKKGEIIKVNKTDLNRWHNINLVKLNKLVAVAAEIDSRKRNVISNLKKKGYSRFISEDNILSFESYDDSTNSTNFIEVIVDRLIPSSEHQRLIESLNLAYDLGDGVITIRELSEKNFSPLLYRTSAQGACNVCGVSPTDQTVSNSEILKLTFHQLRDIWSSQLAQPTSQNSSKISFILQNCIELGLGHLCCGTNYQAISQGEYDRIKLLNLLNLEERSLIIIEGLSESLHYTEIEAYLASLTKLITQGHLIIVTSPDIKPDWFTRFDKIYNLGPGSGPEGGKISIINKSCQDSANPAPLQKNFSKHTSTITFKDKIYPLPDNKFSIITGPSGSGKHNLLNMIRTHAQDVLKKSVLYEDLNISKKSAKLSVGSFLGINKLLAEQYALLPTAKMLGWDQKKLLTLIESHPINSIQLVYKNINIFDLSLLSLKEIKNSFAEKIKIKKSLNYPLALGLDYIRLGQPVGTLSSGESRRLILSKILLNAPQNCTLLLSLPSFSLATEQIIKLANVLQEFVAAGANIFAIDNHPNLINKSDHELQLC